MGKVEFALFLKMKNIIYLFQIALIKKKKMEMFIHLKAAMDKQIL